MNLLTFSGSLRPDATTAHLLRNLVSLAPPATTFTFYEGLEHIPPFSPERDREPAPPPVANLRELIHAADGVIICTPEYAYGMPGTLKNALDWLVSSASFYQRPTATLSASPSQFGGHHAHTGLRLTLTAHHARLSDDTTLTVPHVRLKLAADGRLLDPSFAEELRALLAALERVIRIRAAETYLTPGVGHTGY